MVVYLNGQFAVTLDDSALITPEKNKLILPTKRLAVEIAKEWDKQGKEIDTLLMPNTRMACTAIDRISADKELIVAKLVEYASTDLVCYRASSPKSLRSRQEELWQPILHWVEKFFAAPLTVTEGVMPVAQPPNSLTRLKNVLLKYNAFELVGVVNLTQASGSLVLALGMLECEIGPEFCIKACQIDDQYQIDSWGEESELMERLDHQARDIRASARFLSLLKIDGCGDAEIPR